MPRRLAAFLDGLKLEYAPTFAYAAAGPDDALDVLSAGRAGLVAVGHVVEACDERAGGRGIVALVVAYAA